MLSGAEEARFAGLGVISGFYRPTGLVGDMGGGSLEVIEVHGRPGRRAPTSACRSAPCRCRPCSQPTGRGARKRLDALFAEHLPPALIAEPAFYAVGGGFRAIAKAHMAASGVPVQVVHGYALDAKEARSFAKRLWNLSPDELAPQPGVPARRLSTIPAAALVLDRLLKRLEPERVVFSALGLREGWLYAQLERGRALSRSAGRGRADRRHGGRPRAGIRRRARALDRWAAFRARRPPTGACGLPPARSPTSPGAAIPTSRPRRAFTGSCSSRSSASTTSSGSTWPPSSTPATAAARAIRRPQRRWPCSPRRSAAAPACSAARCASAHRLSGCVGAILETASLHVEAGHVRLEIRSSAGIPDSDTLKSRLQDLAKALRVPKAEIVEVR